MERVNKIVDSIKKFDSTQIANDKVIICLAFVGLISTAKLLWNPLTTYCQKFKQ